jgi:hypothetical protein
VTDGGSAVEETCFVGTPEELVTRYRVDGEQLVGTRTSASGPLVRLVAAPDNPSFRVTIEGRGSGTFGACADDPADSLSMTWSQSESKEDPNLHSLDFSSTEAVRVEGAESQRWPEYKLWIDNSHHVLAMWSSTGADGKPQVLRSYGLTRKLQGGVVRTADRGSAAGRDDQGKKSWQSERAYWDLRSEP